MVAGSFCFCISFQCIYHEGVPALPKVLPGRNCLLFLACTALVMPGAEALSAREQRKVDTAARNGDWVQLWDQYAALVEQGSPDATRVEQFLMNWLSRDFFFPMTRREVADSQYTVSLARNNPSLRVLLNRHPFLDSFQTQLGARVVSIYRFRQTTPEGKTFPFWIVSLNLASELVALPPLDSGPWSLTVMEFLTPSLNRLQDLDFQISYPQGRAAPVFGGFGTKNYQVADLVTPEMAVRVYAPEGTQANFGSHFIRGQLVIYPTENPPLEIFDRKAAGISISRMVSAFTNPDNQRPTP
jgi:hypothetical protein